jgi:hypothetical protein
MKSRPRLTPLWIVILLGVLLRAGLMVRGGGECDDPDNYLSLARSVAVGKGLQLHGRPTAYRPPLYPIMLAPLVRMPIGTLAGRIAVLHLVLGGATVWLTAAAAVGSRLSVGRTLFAAAVAACDPVLVAQSRSVMTETPAACLVAASLAGLSTRGWAGPITGGVALGLAVLCRPSLLAAALLVIAAAFLAQPGQISERLGRGAVIAMTLCIVLLPWAIRNTLVLGEPVWTTTHGGYTLALANNPVYYRDVLHGPSGGVWTGHDQWLWWDSVNRATAGMSEGQADRYLRNSVVRLARERPGDFAHAAVARLFHFWSIAPASAVYPAGVRYATMIWTLPLFMALVLGLLQQACWRWARIAAPLFVIGLTIVHAFFWSDLRMRAPIVPAIALLAASAAFPWHASMRVNRSAATSGAEDV